MSEQATIEYGRFQRDQGIERVSAKAERVHPAWLKLASAYIALYVQKLPRGAEFTSEMLVEQSVRDGIIQAHDDRAWGGPILRAARDGLIEKAPGKMGVCRKRHNSVCVLWRKP
jgi:hypothetical protein